MNLVVMTPVRLLGDGLASCFATRAEITVVAVVNDLASLRDVLGRVPVQVALIDVTQGIDLPGVGAIATEWPRTTLVALGLNEHRQEVVTCGRAGFSGYVGRDASIDALCSTLVDVVAGRLPCPPEISSGLLRALFRVDTPAPDPTVNAPLTRREGEVLELIGRGMSNKEIGSELCLSVATVKHHVHRILEKLKLPRRSHAMRRFRDAPWIARSTTMPRD